MAHRKLLTAALLVLLGMVPPISVSAATIEAVQVHSKIPVDPSDVFWSNYGPTKGKSVVLDLQPQMITNPMWPAPATKWVSVRAVNNGKEIAIRVEWIDPTRNDIMVQSQQYKDQAAVMFPVDPSGPVPPFTMGGEGERVNIWQWKATWNKEGAGKAGNEMMQDLEDQYDYMAMGSGSYYIYEPEGKLVLAPEQSPKVSERHTYIDPGMGKNEGVFNPGRATGNILSDNTLRRSPVEDLNAEGFSTLTTQSHQDVDGSGNWSNNRWMVVFKRSLKTGDPNDTQFTGKETPIAFAIWNGNNKERNGQKALTIFHILKY
ncbi:MAG: ethylbenzene dehydrogenase-related protein [Nitrospinaceae bacterium]